MTSESHDARMDTRPRRLITLPMGRLERWLLGVAGSAVLAAAGIAMFVSDRELAIVAAFVVGAVMATLGIVGLVPLRVTGKEVGVAFAEWVDGLIDTAGPTRAAEILTHFRTALSPEAAAAGAAAVSSALLYQHSVVRAIRRALGQQGTISGEVRTRDGYLVDAMIETEEARVYVEIKSVASAQAATAQLLTVLARSRAIPGRWLVVLDNLPPNQIDDDEITLVQWRAADDDRKLREALRRALAPPEQGA